MRLTYDFHIHTALSPCGDKEMTPNNIVNMAIINELDVIAITDHHACDNVPPVMAIAKDSPLLIIPGMEVESREEIHVVCLFSDLDSVYKMQEFVRAHLPQKTNRDKIFGEQWVMNEEDEIVRKETSLLIFSTNLSIEQIVETTYNFGGVAIPAHIDRPSYSIISSLGMIPEGLKVGCLEVSQYANYQSYQEKYKNYLVLQSSDAHELGYIGICRGTIDVKEPTVLCVIDYLRQQSVILG